MSLFPKKERLNTEAFNRSFSVGTRVHSPEFQLIHHPAEQFAASVVVGKKVSKSAVTRNRTRRRLYSVLYKWCKHNPQQRVVIVIAKPPLAKLSAKEQVAALEGLLQKTFAA